MHPSICSGKRPKPYLAEWNWRMTAGNSSFRRFYAFLYVNISLHLYSKFHMQMDLGSYRKSYEKSELTEATISDNPMELFQKWFYELEDSNSVEEPNAMTVSTVGLDGYPKSRVVLLKKYTHEGFIF